MKLPRPENPVDPLKVERDWIDAFLAAQDAERLAMTSGFKYWYREFWQGTKEQVQARCDLLASTPYQYLDYAGNVTATTNMLIYTFTNTYERYQHILSVNSHAFDDGRTDPQMQQSPAGVVYTEYLTPPWLFEYRLDGGITLLGDEQINFGWVEPEPEPEPE